MPDASLVNVRSLIEQAFAASERMSVSNPHRQLIMQLAACVIELATRIKDADHVSPEPGQRRPDEVRPDALGCNIYTS